MEYKLPPRLHPWLLLIWITLLGLFFAQVEIQIEGDAGWAANLPTWRVEQHWLLDIFWSSRPLTGYHAWVFSFMALVFHLPLFITGQWTPKLETRLLGCLMVFWIIEDFLWFVLNPAFGWVKFQPAFVPWHKHWFLGMPTDYIIFSVVGILCIMYSFHSKTNLVTESCIENQ